MTLMQFHAGGTDNRPQRSRGAPLLADYFAKISLGYTQLQHRAFGTLDSLDRHQLGLIDQGLSDIQHKRPHVSALLSRHNRLPYGWPRARPAFTWKYKPPDPPATSASRSIVRSRGTSPAFCSTE